MKTAMICGVSGQDGALLSRLLLMRGYRVFGTSRDAQIARFPNLGQLAIRDQIEPVSMTLTDFRSVFQALRRVQPDEIYNLAGQSSVGLSFEQPVETMESNALGVLNLLEAVRFLGKPVRIYNACSGECFGETVDAADEQTPFRPRSPYAVAKAAAFWAVANYREAYDLFACSGILFNHESPFRPARFVTRKVVTAACRIAAGSGERLQLGNLGVSRDWGWAPEYVDAMWRMLQQDVADDYVIATGESHGLEEFVRLAFEEVGLDWRDHTDIAPGLLRASDIRMGAGNAAKARECLGWAASDRMPDVVRMIVAAERAGTDDLDWLDAAIRS